MQVKLIPDFQNYVLKPSQIFEFKNFPIANDIVDLVYSRLLKQDQQYRESYGIVKSMLILSYWNADAENGFPLNWDLIVEKIGTFEEITLAKSKKLRQWQKN